MVSRLRVRSKVLLCPRIRYCLWHLGPAPVEDGGGGAAGESWGSLPRSRGWIRLLSVLKANGANKSNVETNFKI